MEKTLQRKALLISQAAECAKNIRELGVLPEEAFDKYENMQANTVSRSILLFLSIVGEADGKELTNCFARSHQN